MSHPLPARQKESSRFPAGGGDNVETAEGPAINCARANGPCSLAASREGRNDPHHLIGELSARLEQLQFAAGTRGCDVTQLRQQVETSPVSRLAAETIRAMALADQLCWDSLSQGDAHAFERQAAISADLRLFGVCARLLDED